MRLNSIANYCCSFLCLNLLLIPDSRAKGQDDAGFWASISVQHRITRELTVSVSEQLRLYQNMSDVEQFFTDAGLEYALSKSFRVSVNYRLASKNRLTYYGTRHRFYADLSYRKKIKPLSFVLRQRFQEQIEQMNSSENGRIPEWYSRSKVALRYDLDKKYRPYIATEFYFLLDDAKESHRQFDKVRYEAGIDYEFNRRHSLNVFYMIQKDLIKKEVRDFIVGTGYTYSF